jgi:Dna[CI] antecedent, DciA
MERASKLIRQLGLPGDTITPDELACAAWPQAVGKKIAAHTRAAKMVRSSIIVEVEDATWQRQLFSLKPFIVRNLAKIVGPGMIDDAEFRIVPRRREPQRAVLAAPGGLFADDADAIEDPVMRGIYKASRTRALA